ncbi:hypothetical protein RJT34_28079 [Clitoria ternatea]|uniref:Uncharacterized protein n=1 Tax=Clitoria ternatea TaxID=43366 RepID=A0AAN9FDA2_CLITE
MKKGLWIAIFMILIHLHLSKATTTWNNNDNLVGTDLESEFFFVSHGARMLYDVSQSLTGKTGNSNGAAVNCPQSQGYRSCLPSQNGSGPRQRCGDYTRTC